MHIVIFAGGTVRASGAVRQAIESADLILAADSGAATALEYGCVPTMILGDFDSLTSEPLAQLQQLGSQIVRVSSQKDETDTELALLEAKKRGARTITLLGALGGQRFEHTLANTFLLTGFPELSIRIIDGPTICWLLQGPGQSEIVGEPGDFLSLFPITPEVTTITTTNLLYPLRGESLRLGTPRGISNELVRERASVTIQQGLLILIHTSKR
ncbi:thiamine diphosphokinase [Dictyobacter aurantiacus]|uniref:Thiamine diphosphokinase n=1 Tax=Dictyobacter aurantiacus TaxID=1936993 RepID=A0A401ZNY3_9CHLR|nr:thiamine diphosphokinase [Dictyobacter aurantiacus]GCE08520.1 thiamine pyrophosphokinase [Dictyobacter aurantiacus]